MYSIQNVIVGTPVTKEVIEALTSLGMNLRDAGYEEVYNGGDPSFSWGYCGVLLDEFDEATDFTQVSHLKLAPTREQMDKAKEMWEALPVTVKEIAPPLDVYFVPSCS